MTKENVNNSNVVQFDLVQFYWNKLESFDIVTVLLKKILKA